MDNEVRIKVKAYDETGPGFASARHGANKTASDIEGDLKRHGPRIGGVFGDGIGHGLGGGMLAGVKGAISQVADLGGTIGGAISDAAGPMVKAGITAAAIAAGPVIGATLSAAVIGGAGIGGVLGGVMLVKDDPRIKAAGASMAANLMSSLKTDASPFVGPVLGAIRQVQSAFEGLRPRIQHILQVSSTFVAPLVAGVTGMLSGITRGFDALVSKAGPTIAALGSMFSDVGGALGDAMKTIAGGSDGATKAIGDLSKIIVLTITSLADLVRGLTEVYSWMHDAGESVNNFIYGLFGMDKETKKVTPAIDNMKDAQVSATMATTSQTAALSDLVDEMKAQTDPLFAMLRGQREVTRAQNNYNDALKKHGPRSQEAKDALNELGAAAVSLSGVAVTAAGSMDGHLTPAMRTAFRNAGLSTGQINALEKQLRSAKKEADRWEGTFTQTYKTIFSTSGRETLDPFGHRNSGYKASGGIVGAANGSTSSGLTWTGEHGPELLDLPPGTRVHSNPDSMRMAATGGGGGHQAMTLKVESGGSKLDDLLVEILRNAVRIKGGGSVQTLLGRPGVA